jgi:hypothetical protein
MLEVSQRHVTAIDKYDEQTTVRIQIGAQNGDGNGSTG